MAAPFFFHAGTGGERGFDLSSIQFLHIFGGGKGCFNSASALSRSSRLTLKLVTNDQNQATANQLPHHQTQSSRRV